MKLNTTIRTLLVGAALSAGSLFANTVVLTSTGYNGNPNAGAGEFLATTSDNGSFLTFCLEHSVPVSFGQTYSYTIDDTVLNQNDKLSKGSAWLYAQFINGTLSGPTGTYLGNTFQTHDINAGLLQKAFWILEDEIAWDASNYYVGLAESVFGAAVQNNYGGKSIKVMNVWSTDKFGRLVDKQSQLINVPDTGMTAALLGLGLLSLAAFRRRR